MKVSDNAKIKTEFLATVLVCIMVLASFAGVFNVPYTAISENENDEEIDWPIERDRSILLSDDRPLRMSADFVYDSESDKAIFFGGATDNLQADYADTWSYDYTTNTWTNMSPSVNPPASDFHQMAYHSGQDKVVLFGGHVSGAADDWLNNNETWTYDYNTNTWTDMDPVEAPPAIAGGSMVYDGESDLVVLFAGSTNDWIDEGMISETWTYDLGTNTWTNVTTSVQPSPRSWPAMAYDSESDYIVLHGGWSIVDSVWTINSDTWTYDTNTNTWTEITDVGPTIVGELAYDSKSDLLVFWGGPADMSELVEDLRSETWTYDTNTETWVEMVNEVKPPPRSRGEVIYDSESDKILLFGGVLDGGWPSEEVVHDCWEYELNNNLWNNVDWDWKELTPAESPEPTAWPAMTYDSESDLVVMFGGHTEEQFASTGWYGGNQTWTYNYNTNTWTNMSPASGPSRRGLACMEYDEESDVIILFGGGLFDGSGNAYPLDETWAYDVNTNIWTNMAPSVSPGARLAYSMTYDSNSDLIILFGGINETSDNVGETWTYSYNTNTWTKMNPAQSPSPRNAAPLAYDKESKVSVLFGGYIFGSPYEEDDTWIYNTTADTWTEMNPVEHPALRSETQAVYDSSVDRVIMFGGWAYDRLYDQTWAYDFNNNTWNETNALNRPSARYWYGFAFDSEANRTILFSGDHALYGGVDIKVADTWAYRYQLNPILLPNAPRNLVVTNGDSGPLLEWEEPIPITGVTVIGYNVYRSSHSDEPELIAELGDVLAYRDKEAGFGITYTYTVTARSVDGEGPESNDDTGYRNPNKHDDGIFSFIAYGDSRASDSTAVASIHDDLVSHYLQHDPEMIIHSGDMVNQGGEAYQWPLFGTSIAAIYDWDPAMKFYGAVGNHEMYTSVYGVNDEDFSTYRDYWDFSDIADASGGTELYYSYDWQGIHFVIINNAVNWTGNDYEFPAEQMAWLENDLAQDYDFTIVTCHYPFYSILKDNPGRVAQAASMRDELYDLFNDTGVDLVFQGHNHYYHRTVHDGMYFVTAAGGGAPPYEIDKSVDTDWQPGDVGFSDYHYCVCSIIGADLNVSVYLLDGTLADTFVFDDIIPDTTPPVVDHPSDIQYVEGSAGHSITWNPSDLYPDRYELYKDGALNESGSWDGSAIMMSVDGHSVGTYNYTLVVYDVSGNSGNDTVLVTVTPKQQSFPMVMAVAIAGGAGIVIIVLILYLRKKK